MALVMTPIYTRVLDNNNTETVTFNNIPQVYTDLMLVSSARLTSSVAQTFWYIYFNGSTATNYSVTYAQGSGSGAASSRESNNVGINLGYVPGANATANTFGNASIYIPNYTSSNFKSVLSEAVAENNTTTAYQALNAGLWRQTTAITSVSFHTFGNGIFAQNSSFSLYGIIRSGA